MSSGVKSYPHLKQFLGKGTNRSLLVYAEYKQIQDQRPSLSSSNFGNRQLRIQHIHLSCQLSPMVFLPTYDLALLAKHFSTR